LRNNPLGELVTEQDSVRLSWLAVVTVKMSSAGEQDKRGGALPNNTLTVLSPEFATTRSTLPSPLKSAAIAATGNLPAT
jgi:hypothetical protein